MNTPQARAAFVWAISDTLRFIYKPIEYKRVILPMTILRRMDCVMQPPEGSPRSSTKPRYSNTSGMSFQALLDDPANLRENLHAFISGFSVEMADVFSKYHFDAEIERLSEAGLLGEIVKQFAGLDLRPEIVSNTEMGDLFEALIRTANTDSPGEDFTPRDAVNLLVDLLLADDAEEIRASNAVRTVYDPTAGTGGLLTVTEERVRELNPAARLRLYGQEINDESYAICKSDVGSRGGEVGNIQQGNTLIDDKHADRRFNYVASNPPYGVDWKTVRAAVEAEGAKGTLGRFPAGLPRVSDGQMLFLQHVVAKLKPLEEGGGRGCIVMSGSPLFNGAAGSGESNIRQWLFKNDLVETIVALPPGLFANTGIGTFIWVLDTAKRQERRGRVQLIDARTFFTKMRKSVGDKNREMSPVDRQKVMDLHAEFDQADSTFARVLPNAAFGYWTVTIERPLRRSYCAARFDTVILEGAKAETMRAARPAVLALGDKVYEERDAFEADLRKALEAAGSTLSLADQKTLVGLLGERDERGGVVAGRGGSAEPAPDLRDQENVPFMRDAGDGVFVEQDIAEYMAREVLPHYPDAWVDDSKTKVGYEVPFTRLFHSSKAHRSLTEIDADLKRQATAISEMLRSLVSP